VTALYGRIIWWKIRNRWWITGIDLRVRVNMFLRQLTPRSGINLGNLGIPGKMSTNAVGYKKRGQSKKVVLSGLALLIAIAVWTFYSMEQSFEPVLAKVAEVKAKQIAVETINRVITDKIVNNVEYQELMFIHKDVNNRPVLIQPNLMKIEKLQATTVLAVNEALKNLPHQEFGIPLGVVLGSKLLAAQGPEVKVSIVPMGTVEVEVINDFKQAGINQPRHILSLKVNTEISVLIPFMSSRAKVSTVVAVADNIIIGPVPSVMFSGR
jgi:sporulation protein YunB